MLAQDPPANLAKRVAAREADSEAERSHYTYRQTFVETEIDKHGAQVGDYREVRDIIFSPEGERTEKEVATPVNNLKRLKLTEEDFNDLRNIQPFLFKPDELFMYETKYRGEEAVNGVDCWLLEVRPRQMLAGQRYFDGTFWIDKKDYSIVRAQGQAVPQMLSTKPGKENLFPHFTTDREQVNGFWFPIHTYADDVLPFSTGGQRIKLDIRYSNYKRFGAESTIIIQK